MTKIILHGDLGKRFGYRHVRQVSSISEACRALSATLPGFRQYITGKQFKVLRGRAEIGADELNITPGNIVRIIPVIEGSGSARDRQSAGKIVLGVALIGVSGGMSLALGGLISSSTIAGYGFTMALTGVSGLISKQPESPLAGAGGSLERPADKPSFLFSGAQNTVEQGAVIPLVYGTMLTGSIIVSAGIYTEEQAT